MKKISLLTTILVSFVMVAFVVLAISIKSGNTSKFMGDGFVINSSLEEDNVSRFAVDTKYNMLNNNAVSFKTVDGTRAVVNNDSFIHYEDGSISAMSDGVIVELNQEIASGLGASYFAHSKTLLLNNGGTYTVNGMSNVSFEDFIYKLNHGKYLVCSKNMTLNLPNNNIVKIKDFLEITYVDNGIVLLSNGENTWTTVSLDSNLELENGLTINFMTREIKYLEEVVLQLNRLLVNDIDNIEILPFQDGNFTIPKISIEGIDGKEGEDGKDGEDGVDGARGASGSGGANGSDGEDGVQPNAAIDLPIFTITDFKVDNHKVEFNLPIPNPITLLEHNGQTAKATVKIYENRSNKLVVEKAWDNVTGVGFSTSSYVTDFSNLESNTEYRLVVTSEYFHKGNKVQRDFLTKSFRTTASDVNIEVAYQTSGSIDISVANLSGENFSGNLLMFETIEKANQYIYEVNNNKNITANPDSTVGITLTPDDLQGSKTINGLKSNNEYAFILTRESGGKVKILSDIVKAKTLKKVPTIVGENLGGEKAKPTVIENPKIYGFDLTTPQIDDPDNSITKAIWKIYAQDTNLGAAQDVLVKTIEVPYVAGKTTPLFIDGVDVKINTTYVAGLELVYNDNIKDVNFNAGRSKKFIMTDKRLPIVRFVSANPVDDKYTGDGFLYILDEEGLIDANSGFTVVIRSVMNDYFFSYKVDAGAFANQTYTILNPFTKGLKENTQHIIDVYGSVDRDGTGYKSDTYIGSCAVNTKKYVPIEITWSKVKADTQSLAAVGFSLRNYSLEDSSGEGFNSIMKNDIKKMNIKLEVMENTGFGEQIVFQHSKPIYYKEGNWYKDDHYLYPLTKDTNGNYIIDIGPSKFFDVDQGILTGSKNIYISVDDSVAYDITYLSDGNWYGDTGAKNIINLDDFNIAVDFDKNLFNKNPYKAYENKIRVMGDKATISLGKTLPELKDNAVSYLTVTNGDAKLYGFEFDNSLKNDTVVGFLVFDEIVDTHRVLEEKTYYMFETRDFNQYKFDKSKTELITDVKDKFTNVASELVILDSMFSEADGYRAIDPITVSLTYPSLPENSYLDTDLVKLKAKKTFKTDANDGTRQGVLFLLKEPPASGAEAIIEGDNGKYKAVYTGLTRGFSYTFAMTASVDPASFETGQILTKTYPYNSTEYVGPSSVLRSVPANAPKQTIYPEFVPYSYNQANDKVLLKYNLFDIDKASKLEDDGVSTLIYYANGNKVAENNTIDITKFENVPDTAQKIYTTDKVVISNTQIALKPLDNLILPIQNGKNRYYIDSYLYDSIYGYDILADLGPLYCGQDGEEADNTEVFNKQQKTIFNYNLPTLTKQKIAEGADAVTAEFKNSNLITKIKFKSADEIKNLAMVELILESTESGSTPHTYRLFLDNEEKQIDPINETTLIITTPANTFVDFSENDNLKIKVKTYFHTDQVGLAYLYSDVPEGQPLDTTTGLFGIVSLNKTGDVNTYLAPATTKSKELGSFSVTSEFAGLKSIYKLQETIELMNFYKLPLVKEGYRYNLLNIANGESYNETVFDYRPGVTTLNQHNLYLPEKLISLENDIAGEFVFPELPIIADYIGQKQATAEFMMKFELSQFNPDDNLYIQVKEVTKQGSVEVESDFITLEQGGVETTKLIYPLVKDPNSNIATLEVELRPLEPSKKYRVYLTSDSKSVQKIGTEESAIYNIVTSSSTSLEDFIATYITESYTNKYVKCTVKVNNQPFKNKDRIKFRIKDDSGNVLYETALKEIETNDSVIEMNLKVFDENKGGLEFGHKYRLEACVYTYNNDVTPIKVINKDLLIQQPRVGMSTFIDTDKTYVYTNSVNFEDSRRQIFHDEFVVQIVDPETGVVKGTLKFNKPGKNSVKNSGFSSTEMQENTLELLPDKDYLVRFITVVDKKNNTLKPGTNEKLPRVETIYNSINVNSLPSYVQVFTQTVRTRPNLPHDMGQINYTINQADQIKIKFINTKNVYGKLSKINYVFTYESQDSKPNSRGAILMANGTDPITENYISVPPYDQNTFEILIKNFTIPDRNIRYKLDLDLYFINEAEPEKITLEISVADTNK